MTECLFIFINTFRRLGRNMPKNYFDFVRQARDNVDEDTLNILVCGSTITDPKNTYPTVELKDYLSKELKHVAVLVEDNDENDELLPKNIPPKTFQMANQSDVVVVLACSHGGTPSEISVLALAFAEKTIFCVKKGDVLGQTIEGWLLGDNITRMEYLDKTDLFNQLEYTLRERKLRLRMQKIVRSKLHGEEGKG